MKTIETDRLILRPYCKEDFSAVYDYMGCAENVKYTLGGVSTPEDTANFLSLSILEAEKEQPTYYSYAAVFKDGGKLIGGCSITVEDNTGEVGWIIHRDFWNRGFGVEMGRKILETAFDTLKLRRVEAHCHAENHGSYKVMEKIGMRREGCFLESRPKLGGQGECGDELLYAMLKGEWDTSKEIAAYKMLHFTFEGFVTVPTLSDGEIFLVCTDKKPAVPEKEYVPEYIFAVCLRGEKIGEVRLKIGYTQGLYYGGQIGYGIDEAYRERGFAERACRLLLPVIKAHKMKELYITCNHTNRSSQRVCEKLGARFIRKARLPESHELYLKGNRLVLVYNWKPFNQ